MSSSSSAEMITTTSPNSTSAVSHGENARLYAAVENIGERLACLERSVQSQVAQVLRRLDKLETDTAYLQQSLKSSQVRSHNRSKSTKLTRCNRKIQEAATEERTEVEEQCQDTGGALSVEIAAIVATVLVQVASLEIGLKIQDEEIGRLQKDVDKLKRNQFQLLMKPVSGSTGTSRSELEARQSKPQTAAAAHAQFAAGNSDEVGTEEKAIYRSRDRERGSTLPLTISELQASLMYARRAERCAASTSKSSHQRAAALGHSEDLLLKDDANTTTQTICDMEVDTVAEEHIDTTTEKTPAGDSKQKQLSTRNRLVKPELLHDDETLYPLQVPKVHRRLRTASLHRHVRSELPRTPNLDHEDHGSRVRSRKEGSEGKRITLSPAKYEVVESADDHAAESYEYNKNGSSQPHAPEELSSSVEGKEGGRKIQDVPAAVDSGKVLSAAHFYVDEDAMTKKVLEAYEI